MSSTNNIQRRAFAHDRFASSGALALSIVITGALFAAALASMTSLQMRRLLRDYDWPAHNASITFVVAAPTTKATLPMQSSLPGTVDKEPTRSGAQQSIPGVIAFSIPASSAPLQPRPPVAPTSAETLPEATFKTPLILRETPASIVLRKPLHRRGTALVRRRSRRPESLGAFRSPRKFEIALLWRKRNGLRSHSRRRSLRRRERKSTSGCNRSRHCPLQLAARLPERPRPHCALACACRSICSTAFSRSASERRTRSSLRSINRYSIGSRPEH